MKEELSLKVEVGSGYQLSWNISEEKTKDIYDIVQLVARYLPLKRLSGCTIEYSYLYYHRVNQKKRIEITPELRKEVVSLASQMHEYYEHKVVPKAEYFKIVNYVLWLIFVCHAYARRIVILIIIFFML